MWDGSEHMAEPLCRRELPTDEVPVIVNFGARIRIYDAGDSDQFADRDSFATGAYDSVRARRVERAVWRRADQLQHCLAPASS